jgi:hypothetical protein
MGASSTTTINIDNTGPEGANDLHLVFDQDVDVKGLDGESPDDPNSKFTIENDGQGGVTISDKKFPNTGQTTLRVKGGKKTKPELKKEQNYWTINGKEVGKRF